MASTSTSSPATKSILLCNRQPIPVPSAGTDDKGVKKKWLEAVPPGAYTTMRTLDFNTVVEWNLHVQRMYASTQSIIAQIKAGTDVCKRSLPSEKAQSILATTEGFETLLRANAADGIVAFDKLNAEAGPMEKRITLLLNWAVTEAAAAAEGMDVYTYVEALPPVPRNPVKVVVRMRPPEAKMYEAKDTKWVTQRARLEREQGDANETVLTNESGQAIEGTQTNFFAVVGGEVYTASDSEVLSGTIRAIVMDVCKENGVHVRLQAPAIEGHRKWEGAFISSTSRLVLPIDRIFVLDDASPSSKECAGEYSVPVSGLVLNIQKWVTEKLRTHSTLIC